MATRAVIARTLPDIEGGFNGVYHHSDGYPNGGLGEHLWKLLHERFQGDVEAMLRYVIDQHSAGWSILFGGEPECYCHPKRKRDAEAMGNWYTHENTGKDVEWVYIFDAAARRLYIRDNCNDAEEVVDLDGHEPDWSDIQCGVDLERCSHRASVHFPEYNGGLSTGVYLGRRDFGFHDAVAVVVKRRRYKMTGCGRNARYGNITGVPENTWISSVETNGGKLIDIPTALAEASGYKPYPGVRWVFPPTRDNPNETIR